MLTDKQDTAATRNRLLWTITIFAAIITGGLLVGSLPGKPTPEDVARLFQVRSTEVKATIITETGVLHD